VLAETQPTAIIDCRGLRWNGRPGAMSMRTVQVVRARQCAWRRHNRVACPNARAVCVTRATAQNPRSCIRSSSAIIRDFSRRSATAPGVCRATRSYTAAARLPEGWLIRSYPPEFAAAFGAATSDSGTEVTKAQPAAGRAPSMAGGRGSGCKSGICQRPGFIRCGRWCRLYG